MKTKNNHQKDNTPLTDKANGAVNAQKRGAVEQNHNTESTAKNPLDENRVAHALRLATERGFPMFWIPAGRKAPACKWKDVATTDPEKIKAMAERNPNCNWGIMTGRTIGEYKLLVIDIDTKDGDGYSEWSALVEQHGFFPDTYEVQTPSKGLHKFLLVPKDQKARTTAKHLSPNIDTRGENALVVAEDSHTDATLDETGRTATGYYIAVEDAAPIAVAPDWLLDLLDKPRHNEPRKPSTHNPRDFPEKSHSDLVEEAREALDYIDPGIHRDDWLKIIAALHDLGDAGYSLALAWSSRWARFNHKKFDAEWNSFNGRRDVQLSTLFFYARQNTAYVALKAKKQTDNQNQNAGYQHNGSHSADTDTDKPQREPVALPPELPPVPAFDYAHIPEVFGHFVKDLAVRMSAPPDFIAFTLLVCAGSVIGRRIGIRPQKHTNWTVVANLWMLAIGRAGFMKSPSMEAGMKFLERLAAAATRIYEEAIEEFKLAEAYAKIEAEAAKKRVKDAITKGNGTASPADLAIDEPDKPIHARFISNDATEPALLEVMRENLRGLLLYRDELVGLLRSLEKDSNAGFRELLLQTYNGDGSYVSDRIERGYHIRVDGLCLSMIGGTQPGKLSKYIKQAVTGGAGDDGLMQRFMLIWPDPIEFEEMDAPPDREKSAAIHRVFRELDELSPESAGAIQDYDEQGEADGLPYVRFDDEAVELFRVWRKTLETRLRDGSLHPAMESHLSKFRKVIPALALIMHFTDGGRGAVGKVPLLRALALSEYLEAHANRTYGSIAMPKVSAAHQILAKIREGKLSNPFRARDVKQAGWTGLDKDTTPEALNLLVEHFWLDAVEPDRPKGGHPTVDYYINPLAEGRL